MKKKMLLKCLLVLLLSLISCKKDQIRDDRNRGSETPKPQLVTFNFKPIKAYTMDMRPRKVIIEIVVVYSSNDSLTLELEAKRHQIRNSIIKIIKKKYHVDMLSVDDYEKIHEEFIAKINSILLNGRILKIRFKNYNIDNMFSE